MTQIDKYYFRTKRYLRNRGEQELNKYRVQLENGLYTITKWDYPNHPQPTLETLRNISNAEVDDEINRTIKPSHTTDIYTITSQGHESIHIAADKQNYCSIVSGNQIHLNKIGLYRITASGNQVVGGFVRTQFSFVLTVGEEQPKVIYSRRMTGSMSFNFVTLLNVNTLYKLGAQIRLIPQTENCEFNSNVVVELM